MSQRKQISLSHSILSTLAFLPILSARASSCDPAFDDNCGFTFSHGAAIGIAIGIFFVVLAVLSLIRMRQRRLAQKANLAFIRNSQAQQAQQGSYYAGPSPYQQPNYMPNNTPTQTYYPPPPGPPPRDVKGHEGPPYDPTNAPQPPPPTYSV